MRRSMLIVGLTFFLAANGLLAMPASNPSSQPAEKRYPTRGRVIRIVPDTRQGHGSKLTVDEEDVPGFMEAMRMIYHVPDADSAATLKAGDKISFDIVEDGIDYDAKNIRVLSTATELKLAKQ